MSYNQNGGRRMGVVIKSKSEIEDEHYLYGGGMEFYIPNSLSSMPLLMEKIDDEKVKFDGILNESFSYFGKDCSIEVENSDDYSDNMVVRICYPKFPVGANEFHKMKVEFVMSGTDLVALRGIIHDSNETLENSMMLPIYSFGIKDGKMLLKYYDEEQVSLMEPDTPFKISNDFKYVGVNNGILPDDKNVAIIDVSECNVEEICKKIVEYLHDNNYSQINNEIANNSIDKRARTQ